TTGNKQEPFVYGSLGGTTVALVLAPPEPTVASPSAPVPAVNAQADMRRDYEFARQIGTKDAWDQFLLAYPTGFYAGLARAARAKLVAEEAKAAARVKNDIPKATATPPGRTAPTREVKSADDSESSSGEIYCGQKLGCHPLPKNCTATTGQHAPGQLGNVILTCK